MAAELTASELAGPVPGQPVLRGDRVPRWRRRPSCRWSPGRRGRPTPGSWRRRGRSACSRRPPHPAPTCQDRYPPRPMPATRRSVPGASARAARNARAGRRAAGAGAAARRPRSGRPAGPGPGPACSAQRRPPRSRSSCGRSLSAPAGWPGRRPRPAASGGRRRAVARRLFRGGLGRGAAARDAVQRVRNEHGRHDDDRCDQGDEAGDQQAAGTFPGPRVLARAGGRRRRLPLRAQAHVVHPVLGELGRIAGGRRRVERPGRGGRPRSRKRGRGHGVGGRQRQPRDGAAGPFWSRAVASELRAAGGRPAGGNRSCPAVWVDGQPTDRTRRPRGTGRPRAGSGVPPAGSARLPAGSGASGGNGGLRARAEPAEAASQAGGNGGGWRSRVAPSCSPVTAGCGLFAAAGCPQFAQNRASCFSSLPH